MRLGLDRLLLDDRLLSRLRGRRVALVANPASMTSVELGFEHALDALASRLGTSMTAAFGPQHGMRGDRQYNMAESPTYLDPKAKRWKKATLLRDYIAAVLAKSGEVTPSPIALWTEWAKTVAEQLDPTADRLRME